jgi:hypothetical protein
MIISHKHKFIFIKTKKTAGTSIEIALSGICGPDDIITPITPEDECIRRTLGYREPQNYTIGKNVLFNHIDALSVQNIIGDKIWSDYFKFCFERNPWDKVVSWYYWEINHGKSMTFEEFIESGHFTLVGGPGGIDLYSDREGNVILDKIYLYENIDNSLVDIASHINIKSMPKLPYTKNKFRKEKYTYTKYYSGHLKNKVTSAFKREINLFNYSF